jgi:hypothetical protein
MEDLKNTFHTPCGHVLCRDCAREWFKQSHSCPTCRQSVYGSTEGSETSLPPPPGYRRMRRRGLDPSADEALRARTNGVLIARDHQIAQELLHQELQIDEVLPRLIEYAEDQERLQYLEYMRRHGRRNVSPSQGENGTLSPLADLVSRRDRFLPASSQPHLHQWLADQPPAEAQEPVPDSYRPVSFLERRRRQEISETLPGGSRASGMSPTGSSTRPLSRRETFPDHRRGRQTAHDDNDDIRPRDRRPTQHHPEELNLPARPTRTPSRRRPTNTQQTPSAALRRSRDQRSSSGGDIHMSLLSDDDEFPSRLAFGGMEPSTLHILSPDRRRRSSTNTGRTSSPLSTFRPRVAFTHQHLHNHQHQHHQRDRGGGGGGGSRSSGPINPLTTSASAAAAQSRDYRRLGQGGGGLAVVTESGRGGGGGGRGRRSPSTMQHRGSRRMDYFFGPPR